MSDTSLNAEALASVYIKIRTNIEALKERHKSELEELESQFKLVSDALLDLCNAQNANTIKTPAGTISRLVTSRYWTNDWDSMYQFVMDNEAPFLLEKRINNGNMKDYLEAFPDKLPVGLQADRKFSIQVRKPNKK